VVNPEGTLTAALAAVTKAAEPLLERLQSPEGALDLLAELGVPATSAPSSLLALRGPLEELLEAYAALEGIITGGDEVSPAALAQIGRVAESAATLFERIGALPEALAADLAGLPAGVDLASVGRRLVDLLLVEYARDAHATVFNALLLAGIIEVERIPAGEEGLPGHTVRRLRSDRLGLMATDPAGLAEDVYGWGSPAFDAESLLQRLQYLVLSLGVGTTLDGAAGEADFPGPSALRLPLYLESTEDGSVELGLRLAEEAAGASGIDAGLALEPYVTGAARQAFMLREGLTLAVEGDADLEGGAALVARPPLAFEIRTGTPRAGVRLDATLEWRREDGEPVQLAAQPDWFRLVIGGLRARVGAAMNTERGIVPSAEIGVLDGELAIGVSKGDGFLQKLLPKEGIVAPFELGVGWAGDRGLFFTGSGGFEVTLAVHASVLGVIELQSVYVRVDAGAQGLEAVIAASLGLSLGPVKAAVDRLGVRAKLASSPAGGNLGRADAVVEFEPPSGAALSIEAGAVVGGGFLTFDRRAEQYAGGIHLEFQGITLNAIGLLTTRMPDGSKGFSLLVIVTASGFTPIQLGFGFTLNGVGGLLGINRTVAVDVLRDGVRNRTLDAILFSRDNPIPRAPQIVSTLRSVFPPAPGRFVFGPMAILGWGSPTVLTLELGVVLELLAPLRLIVMGRLRAQLPPGREDLALVKLNMDVLGVVDFGRREASVDATLYDSSIAGFAIAGDMALRLSWGERPGFALSVGGFHPRFTPPPGFPALRRLSISLSSGENPRLRFEAYLAVTSNTVQLGARLELFASAAGFSISGMLSFDALVQFAPFALDVEIAGSLALKSGETTLMGVDIRVHVTGPAPWHVRGEATFQILFFKVTVSVDATFGEPREVVAPPRVAIWPRLEAALGDAANWGAELPAAGRAPVTVRALEAAPGEIVVHPLGAVSVRQRVVPLERAIDRFANAPPADYRRFEVAAMAVGGQERARERTYEQFAPAAFAEMSDAEKLRSPGFDRMPAGARLQGAGVKAGPERAIGLEYETIVLEAPDEPPATPLPDTHVPAATTVAVLAETGAAAEAAARRAGDAAFASDGEPAVTVGEPRFVLSARDRLARPAGIPATDGSYSGAREALDAYLRANPHQRGNVQVARREEVPA
jgi:hypothetical protein